MARTARPLIAWPFRRLLQTVAATGPGRRLLARMEAEISNASKAVAGDEANRSSRSSGAIDRWHTSEPAPPFAQPGGRALERFNCLCRIEDWEHPALAAAMRRLLPYYLDSNPDFPRGFEHRKFWEFAQVVVGLEQLGALTPEALVLAVGAGYEEVVYDLTTRVRWVFATDIYGAGAFMLSSADARMLLDPDFFARSPYNRNRLVVEQMDALDLRFEAGTFDAVYSLSSIEHFGGMDAAKRALGEMARVLKPGGIAALTTECIVNDAPAFSEPGLELFPPDALHELCSSQADLVPVQDLDFALSERTRGLTPVSMVKALEDNKRKRIEFPHILLEQEGRLFTSFSMFLRKSARPPRAVDRRRARASGRTTAGAASRSAR